MSVLQSALLLLRWKLFSISNRVTNRGNGSLGLLSRRIPQLGPPIPLLAPLLAASIQLAIEPRLRREHATGGARGARGT
jgi:hypothetical protein